MNCRCAKLDGMQACFIPKRSTSTAISLLILAVCLTTHVVAQDSDPRILSEPYFNLSDEAIAAGIDGAYRANLSIDSAGNVRGVRLYGEPAWPCGTSPERELKSVKTAVEDHLKLVKFSPAMNNGKPRESDVMLDFVIGDAFKRATPPDEAQKGLPRVIKAGIVNGRAISLVKPFNNVRVKGGATVQVLIDEQGAVVKAGLLTGNPLHSKGSREAVCASKFSPTLVDGKPVRVTGVITYIYR